MFSVNLAGRVALITGAGRGIGKAIAQGFADSGARVAVNDIDAAAAALTAGTLAGEANAYPADVADPTAVRQMVEQVVADFGRLDFLVNNAGIEPKVSILEMAAEDWQRTLDVNLSAIFYASQAAGRVMRAAGEGVIVNIGSIAGHNIPLKDRAAYVASKAGLVGFTRECAREFAAYGIRVNAVCPGVIETEMTAHSRANPEQMAKWLADIPMQRLGLPEEVVGLVLFLCSDAARYLTGQAINVDGGKVML
ncbi:MAG: SDR family NAD(P)-dependent oxidoreductase [Chloroflexi bacterium]|nr:SDR family NAD(P)-dependent oxidoreductase [Chloroflexota bacterium]MDL1882241.1 glucose 1-dehydrogenase [Anaerolineae bacterium CFX8]